MPRNNDVLVMSWGMPVVMRWTATCLKRKGFNPTIVFRGTEGGNQWVDTAVAFIQDHEPRYLFTWQRLYGQARPIWRMANAYGVKQVVMDFGVWPHYQTAYYDPKGENGASALVGAFDALEADPIQRDATDAKMRVVKHIAAAVHNAAEGVNQVASQYKLKLPGEKGFIFCALQRCAFGRPDKVLELDAVPTRRDPSRFAQDIIREAENQNRFVILKQHPQGKNVSADIPEHGKHHWLMPLIDMNDKASNQVLFSWGLANCSHVVAVNSTTWQLAMTIDKPAAMCGRGWYTRNNIVKECGLIKDAIPTPESSGERGKRFVALMLSRQLEHARCEKPHRVVPILNLIHPGEPW